MPLSLFPNRIPNLFLKSNFSHFILMLFLPKYSLLYELTGKLKKILIVQVDCYKITGIVFYEYTPFEHSKQML